MSSSLYWTSPAAIAITCSESVRSAYHSFAVMKIKAGALSLQWITKKRKERRERRKQARGEQLAESLNSQDLVQEEAVKAVNRELKRLASEPTLSVQSELGWQDESISHFDNESGREEVESLRTKFVRTLRVKGLEISDDVIENGGSFSDDGMLLGDLLVGTGGSLGHRKGRSGMRETGSLSSIDFVHGTTRGDSWRAEQSDRSHKTKRSSVLITQQDMSMNPDLLEVVKSERLKEWASRFLRSDPRHQIMSYFDDVGILGVDQIAEKGRVEIEKISPILKMFPRSVIFTVWRPTSADAIRRMMKGQGVGKGLDIKGKSAIRGNLSGYVPFMQIHEDQHKMQIRTLPKTSEMRIFFRTQELRDTAAEELAVVAEEMISGWESAQEVLASEHADDSALEMAMQKYMWDMDEPEIIILDEYADAPKPTFGVQIPERLFWEAFVMRRDISRDDDSPDDTGRPSFPSFQDMNFATLRNFEPGRPRPVVLQYDTRDPMDARNLLVAYEEDQKVVPVVSDFDCFLVGTKGVAYDKPIPDDQLKLVDWCLTKIEAILDAPPKPSSWTERWLEVLKGDPVKPAIPPYGFGDPKSYSLMELAAKRLHKDGCVRHGAECFNYYFPQMLDDHFLIIGEGINEKGPPWKYVGVQELQEILKERIKRGFTFPLNPKWVLCDPGWKEIYDALLASKSTNVIDSLKCWYPPDSGIREKIDRISQKHPDGFVRLRPDASNESRTTKSGLAVLEDNDEHDGTAAMDLAEQELKSYETFQRAKKRLKAVLIWMHFVMDQANERKGNEGPSDGNAKKERPTAGDSLRESIHPILRDIFRSNMKPQHLKIRSSADDAPPSRLLESLQRNKSFRNAPQLNFPVYALRPKNSLPAGTVAATFQGRHAGKDVGILPSFDESINDLYESYANGLGHLSLSHCLTDSDRSLPFDSSRSDARDVRKHRSKPEDSLESLEEQVPTGDFHVS